jgi:hypothetical protein
MPLLDSIGVRMLRHLATVELFPLVVSQLTIFSSNGVKNLAPQNEPGLRGVDANSNFAISPHFHNYD